MQVSAGILLFEKTYIQAAGHLAGFNLSALKNLFQMAAQ